MSADQPRPPLSRRRFLTGLGAGAAVAVAGGYGFAVWDRNGSSRASAPSGLRPGVLGGGDPEHTLVVLELGGGNDGLNTVVPLTEGSYHDLRPTLAVTNPLALDHDVGLHPELKKLAARYKDGHVAIVEGIGYPDPNLSHFASLDVWWTGDPQHAGASGWLGRFLDGTVGFDDPLAGVSIGPSPSPALLGERSFATSIADATGLQPRTPAWVDGPDDLLAAWKGFAPTTVDPTSLVGRVHDAIRLTGAARTRLDAALGRGGGATATSATATRATAGRGYGDAAITESLALAARLALAKPAPRVVYVSGIGDFDTHQGEQQRHPALMRALDAGVEQLFSTLGDAGERVVLMTTSEFGRRPTENGSGTDHGTAAPHFLVGPAIKGGRYGSAPDLRRLDGNGNLEFAVDFRDYYATVLHGWLGVDPEGVVGRGRKPLPVF